MNILSWDGRLFRLIHVGLHVRALDQFLLYVTYSGDGAAQAVALALALLVPRSRALGLFGLASWATTGITRLLVVEWVGRERPSNFAFAHALEDIKGFTSFPSGHTSTSVALAVSAALFFRGTPRRWIGYLALSWACLVGFSRVYVGVHYPFDVVGGAAFGTMMTCVVSLVCDRNGWLRTRSNEVATTTAAST